MGNFVERLRRTFDFFGSEPQRLILIGLDNAGKTTILYQLKLGETCSSIPTVGFNVEKVQFRNLEFNIWDIGGQNKLRDLWRYYYDNTNAVVFVVDSSDKERLKEAAQTLKNVLADDRLDNCPVLVLANKADIGTIKPADIIQAMNLEQNRRSWYVQPTCALNGSGICEGFEWLAKELKKKRAA